MPEAKYDSITAAADAIRNMTPEQKARNLRQSRYCNLPALAPIPLISADNLSDVFEDLRAIVILLTSGFELDDSTLARSRVGFGMLGRAVEDGLLQIKDAVHDRLIELGDDAAVREQIARDVAGNLPPNWAPASARAVAPDLSEPVADGRKAGPGEAMAG